jgi:hypothetical protein
MRADPFSGTVYVFRARRADRVKPVFWDGTGVCLFAKRLKDGRFRWPAIHDGVIRLTAAQLSALLEALDCPRRPALGRTDPPGVAYVYAPDRKAKRPVAHLAGFKGVLHVDGYGGYRILAENGDVALAFCWSHARRRFYELAATGSAPIASEALVRIAGLHRIESELRGLSADERRAARRDKSHPIIAPLEPWLREKLGLISQKTKLAEAIRYALSRWEGLTRFLDDGRIEIDTNVVERAIRPIALNRKNALFAGSDGGGEHWAIIASLIETCKLNAIDPQAYLADVTTKIVSGHPNSQIDNLLPWAYAPTPDHKAVA